MPCTSPTTASSAALTLLLVIQFIVVLQHQIGLTNAASTIKQGQTLKDGESLNSSTGVFQLTFYRAGYLAILPVIRNISYEPVWIANRDSKVSIGILSLDRDGVLKLAGKDGTSIVLYTPDPDQIARTRRNESGVTATMLDNGNFVLVERDWSTGKEQRWWQSFDHPTDTLLSGMRLSFNKMTGESKALTSWVSDNVPKQGAFTLGINPNNTWELLILQRGVILWRSGVWDAKNKTNLPSKWMNQTDSPYKFNYRFFSSENNVENYFTFTGKSNSTILVWVLRSMGELQSFQFDVDSKSGGATFRETMVECGMGAGEITTEGCEKQEKPVCSRRSAQEKFERMRGYANYSIPLMTDMNASLSDCESKCISNCSCVAYTVVNSIYQIGCYFWSDGSQFIEVNGFRDVIYVLRDPVGRQVLDWRKRLMIIEGIAQGLLYLHNGYMSPEYAMDGIFSVKSDVFSFGVILLEIISGRKNTSFNIQFDAHLNLIGYAWDLWQRNVVIELMDSILANASCSPDDYSFMRLNGLCLRQDSKGRFAALSSTSPLVELSLCPLLGKYATMPCTSPTTASSAAVKLVLVIQFILVLQHQIGLTNAASTIKQGQTLKVRESLDSSTGVFQLTFYLGGYLAILPVIRNISYEPVWIANRDSQVSSGVLSLDRDGVLKLDGDNDVSIVLYTPDPDQIARTRRNKSSVTATMLDNGNFVLEERDWSTGNEQQWWQSFDHPTDTLLSGMRLSFNKMTGQSKALTSWFSDNVPISGAFTLGINPNNTRELLILQRGVIWWRSGVWDAKNKTNLPSKWMNQTDSPYKFNYRFFSSENNVENYFTFTGKSNSTILVWVLRSMGELQSFQFDVDSKSGGAAFRETMVECGMGAGEITTEGCEKQEKPVCSRRSAQEKFERMRGHANYSIRLATDINASRSDCESKCISNCSCVAYTMANSIFQIGCYFWSDGSQFTENNGPYDDIYVLRDPVGRQVLDWRKRLMIIEGIAQGLLYLHKYSRLKIIHRDLKTSNILLDADMNPKISDFGTARIFKQNESNSTNRIIGTYGYMSQYAMDGIFSVKSDVFSFGVILLEIISGRKNTSFNIQFDAHLNLIGYAWDLWQRNVVIELMDSILANASCSPDDYSFMRCIHVGLLCVQESAVDRPTMSEIVSMFANEAMTLPPPKQPAFLVGRNLVAEQTTREESENCSHNDVTISTLSVR
ncbi:hypothetical protein Sjap_021861 [Stephania japonica]|uniref:Uncharacterized protein n=1 Tax=Stephania japonica TaxID=461633 RepID=A0AAP0EN67_9MAGN